MKRKVLWLIVLLAVGCGGTRAQERGITKEQFLKIESGSLSDRIDRAFKQFKSGSHGDSFWLAWHFPAREGVSLGPFSGMSYYDDGIRFERKENPANAALFLLTDGTGAQPRILRVKTFELNNDFVFEKRPVYWLGDIDAAQSLAYLDGVYKAGKESKDLVRGALRAIGALDTPRAVSMLKDVALQDASDDARTAAVSSLARVRTEQVVDALIDLYDRGSGDAVKEEVIRGLGRSESRKASEKLLAIARGDANPKLRQQAVRRLSQTRGDGVWVN